MSKLHTRTNRTLAFDSIIGACLKPCWPALDDWGSIENLLHLSLVNWLFSPAVEPRLHVDQLLPTTWNILLRLRTSYEAVLYVTKRV